MNKLLLGQIGTAGLFLIVALFLYFSAPKPGPLPKTDVIEDIDAGSLRSKYDSPEALVADYKKAMQYSASTETINAALTDYALCQAYRAGRIVYSLKIVVVGPANMS
jgi:hypothetical protein